MGLAVSSFNCWPRGSGKAHENAFFQGFGFFIFDDFGRIFFEILFAVNSYLLQSCLTGSRSLHDR
jgi:hypothetical protein